MKIRILVLAALCCAICYGMRDVSLYLVRPASVKPVVDGDLGDPAWASAQKHTAFYEYFKANPKRSVLKSSFAMCYDANGVYLAIEHFDENIATLKKTMTDRDNPNLWTDDCAELYIDAFGSAIGYRKFTVNSIGTFRDEMRVDASVVDPNWNSSSSVIKAKIFSDKWTIEAFFSWEDMGRSARPGDVWRFCHVRYAFSSGKFIGATSAPGGNYSATDNFGFLRFMAEGEKMEPDSVGDLLMKLVSPPWGIALGDDLLYNFGDGLNKKPLAEMFDGACKDVRALMEDGDIKGNTFQKQRDELLARAQKATAQTQASFDAYKELSELADELKEFKWKCKLETEFNTVPGK